MDREIEGRKPMVPNSLTVSKSGDIYWTDSSSEFKLEDGIFSMLGDGSGRLIHYNPQTKVNKVLIDGLHFANGVILSSNEEFLIVSETARSRIHRYYLKGAKKGTKDLFISGLPGLPDNLNSDGKDGFLVPLVVARDADHPIVFQIFGPFPLLRKFVARLLGIAQASFQVIENLYPNFYSQRAIHWIGHFESMNLLLPRRATILHISYDGKILDSIHCNDLSIVGMSDAHIFKDTLYLGSPFNNYVGKLPLSKIGWQHLTQTVDKREKRDVPVQSEIKRETKPVQQPPPPTAAPVKTPPPTVAPVKVPPPTAAPVKTPPPTAAPVKTPPPTAAPVKKPPPTAAPAPKVEAVKQAPPAAVPVKQTPPVKEVPKQAQAAKEVPKQTAPVKEAPKQTPPPVKEVPKQAPPPPVKEAPKQAPTKEIPKQTPPPVKEAPKQTPPPVKEAPKQPPPPVKEVPKQPPPPVKEAPKQTPPPVQDVPKQSPPPVKEAPKQEPPVVPVKEKVKPKSESIPPRK